MTTPNTPTPEPNHNGGAQAHHNQRLFADYVLNEMLQRDRVWGQWWRTAVAQAAPFLAWLKTHYQAEQAQLVSNGYSESQLEEHWFKPILHQLGHVLEPQAQLPGLEGGIKYPDYVFFADEVARQAAVSAQNSKEYGRRALAVGEVKRWNLRLDKRDPLGGANFEANNPMYQIDAYVRMAGVSWGIISNGRLWRLVHHESSYTLERFFEIDLEQAATDSNPKRALATAAFFLLFFGRASFLPNAQGQIVLDELLAGSQKYQIELENDLRDNAYKALEYLIVGFFAANKGLDPAREVDRQAVYDNSLYLLYRLLFLLYAENRGLLPMHNPSYSHHYSLDLIVVKVDDKRSLLPNAPETGRVYWNSLQELMRLISGADVKFNQQLGIPRYNGGLFDPLKHPFLEQYFVGDRYVGQAIDYLAFRRTAENGRYTGVQRVDYGTLSERQLGSIYEGLLEYSVCIAEEPMVAVRQSNIEKWVAVRERGRAKPLEERQTGEFYLANDRGERKSSGSFYTPDYIVKYMVENTLGPLVEEIRAQTASNGRNPHFVEQIFALNVLDPAMGSGHFLVEATQFLARTLATQVEGTAAPTDEADLVLWRRQVVERCIYGVDKNAMAVELAKLSLWLVTAAPDKPLSFLDHHLRHGDSLVGARLADLATLPRLDETVDDETTADQLALFDTSALTRDAGLAVGGMAAITRLPSESIEDVYSKEHTLRDLRQHLAKWRTVANVWTSHFLGNELDPKGWPVLLAHLQGQAADPAQVRLLEPHVAHPIVQNNDFFHWELEFPEIFFDGYGRPKGAAAGFHAVIGNPPWVLVTDPQFRTYLQRNYETPEGKFDTYRVFIEKALRFVRPDGWHGFVVPNTFLSIPSASKLRHLLASKNILKISKVETGAFTDVSANIVIYILHNTDGIQDPVKIHDWETNVEYTVSQKPWQILGHPFDIDTTQREKQVLDHILAKSTELFHHYEYALGMQLYHNTTHSQQEIESRIHHANRPEIGFEPELGGGNISRYHAHLKPKSWVKIDSNKAYSVPHDKFWSGSRIFVREIPNTIRLLAGMVEENCYANKAILMIRPQDNSPYALPFLLALLNSAVLYFVFIHTGSKAKQELFPRISLTFLRHAPIPLIAFTTPPEEHTAATQNAIAHYQRGDMAAVIQWAEAELALPRNDTLHDLLAYLAEQMTVLNRRKQTHVDDFWADLEGVATPETWRKLYGKGKQEKSLHAKYPALRPYTHSTNGNTITLADSLDWDEEAFKALIRALAGGVNHLSKLVAVYRSHQTAVAPLVHHLATTDALIDQLVYRLYGLTAAEIYLLEKS